MVTRISTEEKKMFDTMLQNLAKRKARKLNTSEENLLAILKGAAREIYQQKPFTTVVVRRVVNGKQIRGLGFTKYNYSDAKIGMKWDETKGKLFAMSRAYHSFIDMLKEEKVFEQKIISSENVTVSAVVESEPVMVGSIN